MIDTKPYRARLNALANTAMVALGGLLTDLSDLTEAFLTASIDAASGDLATLIMGVVGALRAVIDKNLLIGKGD